MNFSNKERLAVVVIDMINDYLNPEGLLYSPAARSIIPSIQRLSKHARTMNWPIIFVNTELDSGDEVMISKWGRHAIKDSPGARIISELEIKSTDLIVTKKFYDGFYQTDLESVLREREVDTILPVGIHTHVCVLLTALGAFYRGYDVTALSDCMTTDNQLNHDSRLPFFETHIGRLTTLDSLINETKV